MEAMGNGSTYYEGKGAPELQKQHGVGFFG